MRDTPYDDPFAGRARARPASRAWRMEHDLSHWVRACRGRRLAAINLSQTVPPRLHCFCGSGLYPMWARTNDPMGKRVSELVGAPASSRWEHGLEARATLPTGMGSKPTAVIFDLDGTLT